jgi:hypothetical protein
MRIEEKEYHAVERASEVLQKVHSEVKRGLERALKVNLRRRNGGEEAS